MARIEITTNIRVCDHCGTHNIKRSFHIYDEDNSIYIGRVCLERETGVNTSGNPYRAVYRVQRYLNYLSKQDRLDEIWELKGD